MERKVSDMTKEPILIDEKFNALRELQLELLECGRQACIIALKGASKYPAVTLKRCFRVVGWAIKAKTIKVQIDMVRAQPIKRSGGLPIVGDVITINRK